MNGLSDQELLREYVASRSEAAFAELVRRHQLTTDGHPNSSVLRSFAKTPEQKEALEFLLREFGPPQ